MEDCPGDNPGILARGSCEATSSAKSEGDYPWSYLRSAENMAYQIGAIVRDHRPDRVVIEETNGGGRAARYTQKLLEFVHFAVLLHLREVGAVVEYVSTSTWRKHLGVMVPKEAKRANAKLRRAMREGDAEGLRAVKKRLGVRGLYSKKHAAIRWVNETYGLDLRPKDNDVAEAVCLGAARLKGAPVSIP